VKVAELNVQNQQKIEWPSTLTVAKAYLDQVARSQALPAAQVANLRKAIANAEKSKLSKSSTAKLATMAPSVEQAAGSAKTPADAARLNALATILKNPSA
jgi:hypothetical protein